MKPRSMLFAVLAAFLVPGAASAAPATVTAPSVSAFALDSFAPEIGVVEAPPSRTWGATRTLESIRYRPRRRAPHHDYGHSHGFSQIHAGFFDPDGDLSRAFLLGVRGGSSIAGDFQFGLGLDWSHRSDRQTTVVREVPLPGGGTAEQSILRARSSSDLFPIMATLQINPPIDAPIQPYFGIGGGYEVLVVSAEDYDTGQDFDATYGGWGWQVWGGAAFSLSGPAKLTAEVFLNNADAERDVDDFNAGGKVREIVNLDGAGLRAGLTWGF